VRQVRVDRRERLIAIDEVLTQDAGEEALADAAFFSTHEVNATHQAHQPRSAANVNGQERKKSPGPARET
jgi:hypothetical protein